VALNLENSSCHCTWNLVKSFWISEIWLFSICGFQYSRP